MSVDMMLANVITLKRKHFNNTCCFIVHHVFMLCMWVQFN